MAGAVTLNWNGPEILARAKEVFAERGVECMERAVALAKKESPFLTGNNRRTITGDFFQDGVETVSKHGDEGGGQQPPDLQTVASGFRIYTQSGYGGYLETGTTKMPARPYIYPGVVDAVNSFAKSVEGSVK